MIRTHEAGTLRLDDAGTTVTLAGWVASRRDHGGVAFLDLRDASGVVQVVVRDAAVAHGLRDEYCIKVVGSVEARPEGNQNPDLATGDVEVMADDLEVLITFGGVHAASPRSRQSKSKRCVRYRMVSVLSDEFMQ